MEHHGTLSGAELAAEKKTDKRVHTGKFQDAPYQGQRRRRDPKRAA